VEDEERKELYSGLLFGVAANCAAALVAWPWYPALASLLVVLAAVNELYGIVLIASPDLLPHVQRAHLYLRERMRRLKRWIVQRAKRLLRRPVSERVSAGGAMAGGIAPTGHVAFLVKPSEHATVDELLAWLVRRDQETHEQLNALERELREHPGRWKNDIEAARRDIRDEHLALERRIKDDRLRLRYLGLAFLALGLILALAGNLEAM
jgi:hypothetical protein